MSTARIVIAGAAAGVIGISTALIAPWEGRELVPYRDIVGVWTVCEGVTGSAVVPGRRYTDKECDALLATEVGRHYAGIAKCITYPIKENEMGAIVSWTYNVGVSAACRSTLVRKVNQGRPAVEFCRELFKWVYAGGKPRKGLENRRRAEYKTCMGYPQ